MVRRQRHLSFMIAILFLFAFGAVGQESILTFSSQPEKVTISPGGESEVVMQIHNSSLHTADNISVSTDTANGLSITPNPGELKQLGPFKDGEIAFKLSAPADLTPGEYDLPLQIIYTYCIEVSCFQIVDLLSVPVLVTTVAIGPTKVITVRPIPPWVIPLVGGILLLAGILLWVIVGVRLPLYIVLGLLAIGGLAYGIQLNQHEQAQGIAAVLCTSCVGIESPHAEEPHLSPQAVQALAKITSDIDLIVFYAPWCHTCPYAEALVKKMAQVNSHIRYQLIDVSDRADLAQEHGIIRNNRAIVPAVFRSDTGMVNFGIDNLEQRLLNMLGVGA